jgi:hypothetical protein
MGEEASAMIRSQCRGYRKVASGIRGLREGVKEKGDLDSHGAVLVQAEGAMRKRGHLIGLATLLVVILVGLSFWQGPGPINRYQYAKIQVGMSRAEVEEILGGPPGPYYTTGSTRWRRGPSSHLPVTHGFCFNFWCGSDYEICVYFTKDGKVAGKDISGVYVPAGQFGPSPPEWVRRGKRIRSYNDQDAELVRKIEAAVAQKVPRKEIEQFVGIKPAVGSYKELRYLLLEVSPDEWSGPALTFYCDEEVTLWKRPSVPKGVVGILWREDGSGVVVVGLIAPRGH